ncbi:hypothetical protein HN51_066652 [Arachis hypogaea]
MMNEVTRWTKDLEKRCSIKRQNGVTDVLHPAAEFIGDPCVAKTKGAPKLKKNETRKRSSCSNCFVKGHTKRHCPKLVDEGDRSHDHLPSRCTDTDENLVLSSWVLNRIWRGGVPGQPTTLQNIGHQWLLQRPWKLGIP